MDTRVDRKAGSQTWEELSPAARDFICYSATRSLDVSIKAIRGWSRRSGSHNSRSQDCQGEVSRI